MRTRFDPARKPAVIAVILASIMACADSTPTAPPSVDSANTVVQTLPSPPSGLMTATFGTASLQLWPFTGTDLAGATADPMNILFTGNVDVLSLRSALLELNGDRTAFGLPAGPPFDCVWKDAFGDMQSAFATGAGWVANPVQLACGDYSPMRFHIRLFPAGSWVMGGAHFDLLVPGTADHRVISWELPELLIRVDFLRSGLLDPGMPFGFAPIGPAPTFRTLEAAIFNAMPDPLKVLVGLPMGTATVPVPLPTDGLALILNMADRAPLDEGTTTAAFDLNYDLVIPRPICATGPADVVRVQGPVHFEQRVHTNGSGGLESLQVARGDLLVTPVDPFTGAPSGATFRAHTEDLHATTINNGGFSVESILRRDALPAPGTEGQSLMTLLNVGSRHASFMSRERC